MKKLFALLLTAALLASLPLTALAADSTVNYDENRQSQTSGLNVTYQVAPAFTVTIPADVTLNNSVTVSAADVVVEYGKAVNVTISGTSGENNAFQLRTDEGAVLASTVKKGDAEVRVGDTVLSVTPTSDQTAVELTFVEPENYTYAGLYKGTVTFTVSVDTTGNP